MLFRSHLRTGVSVLGLARSADGLRGWRVTDGPAMLPARLDDQFAEGVDRAKLVENETGGIEDPRISRIDQIYYITYSAYDAVEKDRVRVSLATTTDFETFTRYGPVLDRDMRNVVIFPERIGDRSVGLFRPNDCNPAALGGRFAEIRIGTTEKIESNDWTIADEPILRTGGGPSAFSDKIGPGAPPLRTPHGWLDIFHGVRATMATTTPAIGLMK